MKKIYFLFVLQTLIFCGVTAQTWEWTKPEPNGNLDYYMESDVAHDVELDVSGNAYVLGEFNGSLYLDYNLIITNTKGSYLAKYNPEGVLLWYQLIEPTSVGSDIQATDLIVNTDGVFLTGRYSPSQYSGYDCLTGQYTIFSETTYRIGSFNFPSDLKEVGYFLAKLNFDGSVI